MVNIGGASAPPGTKLMVVPVELTEKIADHIMVHTLARMQQGREFVAGDSDTVLDLLEGNN